MNKKWQSTENLKPRPLSSGRVHEVCGPAAHSFAMAVCGEHEGTIIWIEEMWRVEQVLPAGFLQFCNPGRMIMVRGRNHMDMLWAAEECLRSSAAPIVITRLSQPPDFTQGRRLQLAARTGQSLGLFIIPEGTGTNAAETRWLCTPCFDANDSTPQRWKLIKNKTGTLKDWIVNWDEQAHHFIVVSEAGERPHFARAAD